MFAGGFESLLRPALIPELASVGTEQPVAVRHPELAPLVRRLDVVVVSESLIEPLLRLVRLADPRGAKPQHAICRRFFIAIAQLAAMIESRLRLLERFSR